MSDTELTTNQETITLTDDEGVVYILGRKHLNDLRVLHYGQALSDDRCGNVELSVSLSTCGSVVMTRPANQADELIDLLVKIIKLSITPE
ncbi:MAG TPA: hypothetical protein O0X18_01225 [Methanocorpusculum sp.]|nr:hypothetical protein [Methanocorpusculum sp.]